MKGLLLNPVPNNDAKTPMHFFLKTNQQNKTKQKMMESLMKKMKGNTLPLSAKLYNGTTSLKLVLYLHLFQTHFLF
jgi:hypothetical protein